MHILNYEVHNIMRISDLTVPMEGKHLVLVGAKNKQGKTSAIIALLAAICGKRRMDWPPEILKRGEDHGYVRVQTTGLDRWHEETGFTIELHLERREDGTVKESIKLLDSEGCESDSPRTMLRSLFKFRAFDPREFERLAPKDRRQTLLEIIGIDMDAFNEAKAAMYDERAAAKKEWERLESIYDDLAAEAVETERVDVDELVLAYENERDEYAALLKEQDERAEAEKELDRCELRIHQLKMQIKELEREKSVAVEKRSKTRANLDKLKDECRKRGDAARDAMRAAQDTNEKAEEWKRCLCAREAMEAGYDRYKSKKDAYAALVEKIKAALEEAEYPVEGLTVSDDDVVFNGVPLEQCSGAERLTISARIGMALNPDLKLFVSQDGSDLDDDSLVALDKLLTEHGYQMILEYVTRDHFDETKCAVVLEGGREKHGPTKVERMAVAEAQPSGYGARERSS